ncbi:MAG: 50S ribosomal protein L22 [Chlamydiales bacterium]
MATAKAQSKYLRLNPRKAVLAADLIRGKTVSEAMIQLEHSQMKAGRFLKKTLDSAVANAETQWGLSRDNLRIVEVKVDKGPQFKRGKPKNKGGTHAILKKTSHLTVVVGE